MNNEQKLGLTIIIILLILGSIIIITEQHTNKKKKKNTTQNNTAYPKSIVNIQSYQDYGRENYYR